jgi:hypothetical protein
MVERRSKASYEKGVKSLSPDLCPQIGKRGQGRNSPNLPPTSTPGLAELRISKYVLYVNWLRV